MTSATISYNREGATLLLPSGRTVDIDSLKKDELITIVSQESISQINDFMGSIPIDEFIASFSEQSDLAATEEMALIEQFSLTKNLLESQRQTKKDSSRFSEVFSTQDIHDNEQEIKQKEKKKNKNDSLRRVYVRKGIMHVCANGGVFRTPVNTVCIKNDFVTIGPRRSDSMIDITIVRNGDVISHEQWYECHKASLEFIIYPHQ